ncbi:hypothetical protein TorRG33x02_038700 [Trema orientale]|uniref:Uncharacterized protein n=1 Tax=Trema orientale TaxID=63057 RepID=A0A2P5FRM5_TREOI|nr:hypothetical protein TorRG33x02_038700 [Trema orientale]
MKILPKIKHYPDQQIGQNPNLQRAQSNFCSLVGELNTLLVDFHTQVIDFHICPHHQLVPLGVPRHDLKPHRSRQIHPEKHRLIGRKQSTDLSPVKCLGREIHRFGGLLLVTLVKRRNGVVVYEGVPVRVTDVGDVRQVEIHGVVVNTLVFVAIVELQAQVNGGVLGVIQGLVQGWKVNILNRTSGF